MAPQPTPSRGTITAGSAVGYTPSLQRKTFQGDAFSFSQSYIEADATPTSSSVTTGDAANFGNTSTAAGTVWLELWLAPFHLTVA